MTNSVKDTSMTDQEIRLWALELVAQNTKADSATFVTIERVASLVLSAKDQGTAMRIIEASAKMVAGAPSEELFWVITMNSLFVRTGSHRPQQQDSWPAVNAPRTTAE